jgi:hypothetical protein
MAADRVTWSAGPWVFSPNPVWRGETKGSDALAFNAILPCDHLDAGRKWDDK